MELADETKKLLETHHEVTISNWFIAWVGEEDEGGKELSEEDLLYGLPCCIVWNFSKRIFCFYQNLSKLSNKLEDERKKAILDLERKMKQRRLQREKTLTQLVASKLSNKSHR